MGKMKGTKAQSRTPQTLILGDIFLYRDWPWFFILFFVHGNI